MLNGNDSFIVDVVHCKKDPDCFPVYRGFPLGNPFRMLNESERDKVCDEFESYFRQKVLDRDPVIMSELARLVETAFINGGVKLGCYCSPKRCHAQSIKTFLELVLNGKGFIE